MMGIEPTLEDWKSPTLTVVLHPQIYSAVGGFAEFVKKGGYAAHGQVDVRTATEAFRLCIDNKLGS